MRQILLFLVGVVTSLGVTTFAYAQFVFGTPAMLPAPINVPNRNAANPNISSDRLSLYFRGETQVGNQDISVVERTDVNNPWGTVTIPGPPLNTSAFDVGPSITRDDLSLFFYSDRLGGEGNDDIWFATRSNAGGPWEEATNVGDLVNTSASESDPDISADGFSLYFTRRNAGDPLLGSSDNYVSHRSALDAPWGTPVNLGLAINRPDTIDSSPTVSADGKSLFFYSWKLEEDDQGQVFIAEEADIYVSIRASVSDPWQPRVKLSGIVNTFGSELQPDISEDGSTLYFTRADCISCFSTYAIWEVPITGSCDLDGDGNCNLVDLNSLVPHQNLWADSRAIWRGSGWIF